MMAKKMQEEDTEEELREAFKVFDKDGNGWVQKYERLYIYTYIFLYMNTSPGALNEPFFIHGRRKVC